MEIVGIKINGEIKMDDFPCVHCSDNKEKHIDLKFVQLGKRACNGEVTDGIGMIPCPCPFYKAYNPLSVG
jgi:hypothetical protein